MHTNPTRPGTWVATPAVEAAGTWPATHPVPGNPVAPAEICRAEPVLIELQSLLAHTGAETLEALLLPALIVHRKRLHMLRHDIDLLDNLANERQAPGQARALQVRDQLQRWAHDGLLATVRHQALTESLKPAAMARFFRLFSDSQPGCLITQSREAAQQMLDPLCWQGPRRAPLVVSVERSSFVALSMQPLAAAPATPAPAPAAAVARPGRQTRATPQALRWVDRLIDDGYVFVPDTSALMHSPRQTARRFFERELLPRLLAKRNGSAEPGGAGGGASPGVWVHRRVRGELMRLARADDQKLVAKAADGLKAITMLADAGLVTDHDDAEGTRGSVDSYADPALELLLRKHQRRQRLCILTQDRALAAKLLAQRDAQSPGRAEIARLCVDGNAAIEDWDGLLSVAQREQAAREVSVDARVEAQLMGQAAPPSRPSPPSTPPPRAPTGPARRPPAERSEAPAPALPNGARPTGTLARWKDEQGYGFIRPDGGGPDIFLHIRTLPPGSRTPREGDRFTCLIGRDGQGRLRAERAWPEQQETRPARTPPTRSRRTKSSRPLLLAALLMAALAGLAWWLIRR